MTRQHLDRFTLERFAAAELEGREMVATSRHLLACPACRARLRRDIPGGDELIVQLRGGLPTGLARLAERAETAGSSSDYDAIFHRLESSALRQVDRVAREKAAAPQLADELLSLPVERRPALLTAERRFQNAAVVVALLERCRALWGETPSDAASCAELALHLAERIGRHGPAGAALGGLSRDLQARSWAYLGNVRRIQGDFRAAEQAFERSTALLAEGSGDPLERARLLDLRASLLRAQRRFDAALDLLGRAAGIYRRVGEHHLEGRVLLSQAMVHGCAGAPEKAIPLLRLATERIDPREEPHLLLAALNNLLVDLTDLGRLEEAEALLPNVRHASAEAGTRFDRSRCRWAEAQLAAARGRLEQAEVELRQVREEFLAEGLGYEPALVSLELARLYLLAGRTDEVREMAAGLHLIFATREVHREALAAFQIFTQAVAQEQASVRLVEDLISALRHGRGNPACRSDRPS